jgi:hypothetical protein
VPPGRARSAEKACTCLHGTSSRKTRRHESWCGFPLGRLEMPAAGKRQRPIARPLAWPVPEMRTGSPQVSRHRDRSHGEGISNLSWPTLRPPIPPFHRRQPPMRPSIAHFHRGHSPLGPPIAISTAGNAPWVRPSAISTLGHPGPGSPHLTSTPAGNAACVHPSTISSAVTASWVDQEAVSTFFSP